MYTNHFGLRSKPFEDRADPQFFVATPHHEEALAAMVYASHHGEGITLVVGEAGTGKTLLIRSLVLRLHAIDRVVVLTCPRQGEMDLIRETCKAFGVTLPTHYKPDRGLARLRSDLSRSAIEDHRSILIVDQAEALSDENLSHLTRFTELQDQERALLSIILVGRNRVADRLARSDVDLLQQNIVTESRLHPLTLSETESYIRDRLHVAGGADVPLFADEAVAAIHRASGGIPRGINRLCEKSLLSAFGAHERKVTCETAVDVIQEQIGRERSLNAREAGLPPGGDPAAGFLKEGQALEAPWPTYRPDAPTPTTSAIDEQDRGDWEDPYFEPPSSPDTVRDKDPVASARRVSAVLTENAPTASEIAPTHGRSMTPRAQRSAGSFDAPPVVESHLVTLTAEARFAAESLVHRLNQTQETSERLQGRIDHELVEAERRATAVSTELNRVAVLAAETAEQTKRLEASCGRAERIENRLASFADELVDKADRVQERISQLLSGLDAGDAAEQRMQTTVERITQTGKDAEAALDRRLDGIARTVEEAEQRIATHEARLRKAAEDGASLHRASADEALDEYRRRLRGEFETIRQAQAESIDAARCQIEDLHESVSTLTTRADRARGTAAADHDRLQNCQQAYAELAEKVETQLEGMRRSIESVSRDADAGLARLREQRDAVARETISFHEQFTETSMDSYRRRLHEQFEQFEQLHGELLRTTEAGTEELREQIRTVSAQSTADAGRLRDEHQKMEADSDAAVRRLRAAIEEAVQEAAEQQSATLQEAQDRQWQQLQEVHTEQKRLLDKAAETASDKVGRNVESIHAAVAETDATIMAALTDYRSKSGELVSQYRYEVESLRHNLETLRKPVVELDAAADGLGERIDHAAARLAALSDNAAALDASATATAERGNASRRALSEAADRIDRLLPEVQAASGTVESLQRQVAGMLVEIGGTCERAREMREQMAGADQVLGRLARSREEAHETADTLHGQVEAAEGLEDTMRRLTADADGKIAQLDSHTAAASSVLHSLADANMSAHSLITQANDATLAAEHAADAAKEQAGRAAGNLDALCSTSADLARSLHAANGQAERLLEHLNDTTEPAAVLAEQLANRADDTRQKVQELVDQCARASELADRLTPLANILAGAKDLDESVRATIGDARRAQSELAPIVETGRAHMAELHDAQETVSDLVSAQERLGRKADAVSEKLAEQIGSAEDLQDTSKRLLREFVTQARAIETQLTTLRKQSGDIEQRVSEALSAPGEMITTARAQAAELERVCTAVRKVFAGLSKVSLEAQAHTTQFKEAGRNAEQRLAALAVDTERASQTLHEWIEEALRVQARLERTLGDCPSIRETHPGHELRAVLTSMKASGTSPEPSREPSEAQVAGPSAEGAKTKNECARMTSSTAMEIAQLIEDAKSAAGGGSGRASN